MANKWLIDWLIDQHGYKCAASLALSPSKVRLISYRDDDGDDELMIMIMIMIYQYRVPKPSSCRALAGRCRALISPTRKETIQKKISFGYY